jgi:hypothetical protein
MYSIQLWKLFVFLQNSVLNKKTIAVDSPKILIIASSNMNHKKNWHKTTIAYFFNLL